MKKKIIGIAFLILTVFSSPAQTPSHVDSQIKKTDSLLLSYKRQKALELIVPLYQSLSRKNTLSKDYKRTAVLYVKALEMANQNQEAVTVGTQLLQSNLLNDVGYFNVHIAMARLHEKLGNTTLCVYHLKEAKKYLKNLDSPAKKAEWLVRLSSYHRVLLENPDSARHYAEKVLQLNAAPSNKYYLIQKACAYFLIAFVTENFNEKIEYLKKSLNVWEEVDDKSAQRSMYIELYKSYRKKNRKLAKKYMDAARKINIAIPIYSEKGYFFETLSDYYREIGQYDSALLYSDSAHYYFEKAKQAEAQATMYIQGRKFKTEQLIQKLQEKKSVEEAMIRKQNQLFVFLSIISVLLIVIGYIAYINIKRRKAIFAEKQLTSEKNTALETSLKRNKFLVQEIHHRVKNNLQYISSMLNLQRRSSNSIDEIASLKDTGRRISSITLMHEMLYSKYAQENKILIKEYIARLIQTLNKLTNTKNLPIQFKLDCDNILLDASKSTAIGMITSEIISNSIKYAFENEKEPTISISLKKQGDTIIYAVGDNGQGLENNASNGIGMRLIDIFSRQLEGNVIFENQNGLNYSIAFDT